MSHTPGKLTTKPNFISLLAEDGKSVANCGPVLTSRDGETAKANARRLAACWNFMLDVPIEYIETLLSQNRSFKDGVVYGAEGKD